jgi:sporulation protein YlmC with PRC-barrel domain
VEIAAVDQARDSFFRHYLGLPVIDAHGERIGRVTDLAVRMGEEFPRVSSLAVHVQTRTPRLGASRYTSIVPWELVARVEPRSIRLSRAIRDLPVGTVGDDELLLKKNIMDQQVVDDRGKKILRVNDIKLAEDDGVLRLVGVDTGMLGLLTRLGPMRRMPALARFFRIKIMQNIIMWDIVDEFDREMNRIKLGISQEMVKDLYNL